MLRPIEMLNAMREPLSLSEQDIALHQVKLLEALALSETNPDVVAIFAHGADALRVIPIGETGNSAREWAVQTWSFFLQEWVTQKTYGWNNKKKAIELARNWYPSMSQDAATAKWRDADDPKKFDELFSSAEKLAEFLYDTKVIAWTDGNPWPLMTLIASTVVASKGMLSPGFSLQEYAARQKIGNFDSFNEAVISAIDRLSLNNLVKMTPPAGI